ncbi:hypothetical protein [Phycicoccus sp. SLBN-51]|uniref:hypothetical protein n=1 Tax=Phycicoccus sp. SLBN-51 TaxID=2768447 RepID=UPI00135CA56D|nr:hypothetical protein [Phycicoccus sp. SLBN-51]
MTMVAIAATYLLVRRRLEQHRLRMQHLRAQSMVLEAGELQSAVAGLNAVLKDALSQSDIDRDKEDSRFEVSHIAPRSEGTVVTAPKNLLHIEARLHKRLLLGASSLRLLEMFAEKLDALGKSSGAVSLARNEMLRTYVEEFDELGRGAQERSYLWALTLHAFPESPPASTPWDEKHRPYAFRAKMSAHLDSALESEWVNDRPRWLDAPTN